jgi:hypothetical protein
MSNDLTYDLLKLLSVICMAAIWWLIGWVCAKADGKDF